MLTKGHSKQISVSAGSAFPGGRILIALTVLLVLVCSVCADARQTISQVTVTGSDADVQITLTANGPLSIAAEQLSKHLVFNVKGYLASDQGKTVKINSGDIGTVRCVWYRPSPPMARVAVEVDSKRPYSIRYSGDKRQATIVVRKRVTQPASAHPMPEAVEPAVAVRGSQETCVADSPPIVEAAKPVMIASAQPVVVRSAVVTAAPAVSSENRISLDFVGSDIHDVLKALSLQSNTNVVASTDVKGQVTVALNNVTVEDALKLVTNLSGYKFQKVDDTYVVGTPDNLNSLVSGAASADAARVAEVAMVRHSDPVQLSKMLAAQYKGMEVTSTAVADDKKGIPSGTNMMVLSGTADQVQSARNLVAMVENSLEARAASTDMDVYQVKYADINELANAVADFVPGLRVTIGPNQGFNLESPKALSLGNGSEGSSGSSGDQKIIAPPKTLLLRGSSAEIGNAKEFLSKVDVRQPQIVIEAKVLDIYNDDSKDLGIDWNWNTGVSNSTTGFSELHRDETGSATGIMLGRFQRSPLNILATLNAMVRDEKAKVLANPSISALDGKPASIFIGKELKYVVNIQQTPTGINVTTETARIGVQLHSVSRVSSDGFITMDLHPEVSSPVGDGLTIGELGITLPEISRRYIDTTVRVKDGETIVIGGLISDEERQIMSGIPILSDLPLIGNLFRTKSKSKNHSEIMMFITPRILADDAQ